jgi:hypothetical protein
MLFSERVSNITREIKLYVYEYKIMNILQYCDELGSGRANWLMEEWISG